MTEQSLSQERLALEAERLQLQEERLRHLEENIAERETEVSKALEARKLYWGPRSMVLVILVVGAIAAFLGVSIGWDLGRANAPDPSTIQVSQSIVKALSAPVTAPVSPETLPQPVDNAPLTTFLPQSPRDLGVAHLK